MWYQEILSHYVFILVLSIVVLVIFYKTRNKEKSMNLLYSLIAMIIMGAVFFYGVSAAIHN